MKNPLLEQIPTVLDKTQDSFRLAFSVCKGWEQKLLTQYPIRLWERLCKKTVSNAKGLCEVCRIQSEAPLKCSAQWKFVDETKVQKLAGLVALCPTCYAVEQVTDDLKLLGVQEEVLKVLTHLSQVNGWPQQQAKEHLIQALQKHKERSKYNWTLDLSWLDPARP